MTKKPTDREIIQHALELLGDGLLASLLPGHLMMTFQITRERAGRLASEAVKRSKSQTARLRKG